MKWIVDVAYYYNKGSWDTYIFISDNVTHWQPFPKPPKD